MTASNDAAFNHRVPHLSLQKSCLSIVSILQARFLNPLPLRCHAMADHSGDSMEWTSNPLPSPPPQATNLESQILSSRADSTRSLADSNLQSIGLSQYSTPLPNNPGRLINTGRAASQSLSALNTLHNPVRPNLHLQAPHGRTITTNQSGLDVAPRSSHSSLLPSHTSTFNTQSLGNTRTSLSFLSNSRGQITHRGPQRTQANSSGWLERTHHNQWPLSRAGRSARSSTTSLGPTTSDLQLGGTLNPEPSSLRESFAFHSQADTIDSTFAGTSTIHVCSKFLLTSLLRPHC